MHAWEAIEQSLPFIEEHLAEEISTEELANTVGLSPFYFQRLFKRLVNKSVQEYVKLRRLARVIENLGDSERRILDVALDYGFSSHANFTRAFKETFGITPEDYRRVLRRGSAGGGRYRFGNSEKVAGNPGDLSWSGDRSPYF